MTLQAFRQQVAAWLEENCPQSMRTPMPDEEICWGGEKAKFISEDQKTWLKRCAAEGYTVPHWAKKYGGAGLSKEECQILRQEMRRLGCRPPLYSFGIWMLGPALLEFASEEQKLQYLPPIARGEIRWCQGYSEPGAGSDLASLATRAVDQGDHYSVSGQKIWTSYADESDWMFCLVRTDTSDKHGGISFVVFSMAEASCVAKPIRLISGRSPFCEVFLTEHKVPKSQRIGQEGSGWTIAKALLQHERTMIGELGQHDRNNSLGYYIQRYAEKQDGRISDAGLRERLAKLEIDNQAFLLSMKKFQADLKGGARPGPAASLYKYVGCELKKAKSEAIVDLLGYEGLGWQGEGFDDDCLEATRRYLRSKGYSIEGGTSEIQLNIIAKRVLGLPDGGKVS